MNEKKEQHVHRYGLLKVKAGANYTVMGAEGRPEVIQARDKLKFGGKATKGLKVRCLDCKRDFESPEELVASHPEYEIMKRAQQKHLWGWYSGEIMKGDTRPIGLLSDERLLD